MVTLDYDTLLIFVGFSPRISRLHTYIHIYIYINVNISSNAQDEIHFRSLG